MRVDARSGPNHGQTTPPRGHRDDHIAHHGERTGGQHWHVHGVWLDVLPQRCPYESLASHAAEWTDVNAPEAILAHGPWDECDQLSFETQLMIVPGYRVRMVCGLVTNFHQPGSTLLCLVSAFVGMDAGSPSAA